MAFDLNLQIKLLTNEVKKSANPLNPFCFLLEPHRLKLKFYLSCLNYRVNTSKILGQTLAVTTCGWGLFPSTFQKLPTRVAILKILYSPVKGLKRFVLDRPWLKLQGTRVYVVLKRILLRLKIQNFAENVG